MTTTQTGEMKSGGKQRSTSYPSINLETAINQMTRLRSELGKGPYSREDAAKGMGYSGISGASARAVAALVQYGLLVRNGNAYLASDLSEEITHPTDASGVKKAEAVMICAKSPKLFQKIIDRFKDQSLPGLLDNILMREGINSNTSKEAATILRDSLLFAGILQNGIVRDEVESKTIASDPTPLSKHPNSGIKTDLIVPRQTDTNILRSDYTYVDSGEGWNLMVSSGKQLNSAIKKLLIEASELLTNIQDTNEDNDK